MNLVKPQARHPPRVAGMIQERALTGRLAPKFPIMPRPQRARTRSSLDAKPRTLLSLRPTSTRLSYEAAPAVTARLKGKH